MYKGWNTVLSLKELLWIGLSICMLLQFKYVAVAPSQENGLRKTAIFKLLFESPCVSSVIYVVCTYAISHPDFNFLLVCLRIPIFSKFIESTISEIHKAAGKLPSSCSRTNQPFAIKL